MLNCPNCNARISRNNVEIIQKSKENNHENIERIINTNSQSKQIVCKCLNCSKQVAIEVKYLIKTSLIETDKEIIKKDFNDLPELSKTAIVIDAENLKIEEQIEEKIKDILKIQNIDIKRAFGNWRKISEERAKNYEERGYLLYHSTTGKNTADINLISFILNNNLNIGNLVIASSSQALNTLCKNLCRQFSQINFWKIYKENHILWMKEWGTNKITNLTSRQRNNRERRTRINNKRNHRRK